MQKLPVEGRAKHAENAFKKLYPQKEEREYMSRLSMIKDFIVKEWDSDQLLPVILHFRKLHHILSENKPEGRLDPNTLDYRENLTKNYMIKLIDKSVKRSINYFRKEN